MTLTSSQIINRLCLAIVCALWVRGSVSLGQPVEATDPLLLAPVEAEPISVGVGSRDLVNFEVETRIRELDALTRLALDPDLDSISRAEQRLIDSLNSEQTEGFIDRDLEIDGWIAVGDGRLLSGLDADYSLTWQAWERAFEILGSSTDIEWARARFCALMSRALVEPFPGLVLDPVLLVKTMGSERIDQFVRLAESEDYRGLAIFYQALYAHHDTDATIAEILRVRENYETALNIAGQATWSADANFFLARWLEDMGTPTLSADGELQANPDQAAAVVLYEALQKSEVLDLSMQREIAGRLSALLRPVVELKVPHVFLPGGEVEIALSWRNVGAAVLRLYRIPTAASFDFRGLPREATWVDAVSIEALDSLLELEIVRDLDDNPFRLEERDIVLPQAAQRGFYLVEVVTEGGSTKRQLIQVADLAIVSVFDFSGQQLSVLDTAENEVFREDLVVEEWMYGRWDATNTSDWQLQTRAVKDLDSIASRFPPGHVTRALTLVHHEDRWAIAESRVAERSISLPEWEVSVVAERLFIDDERSIRIFFDAALSNDLSAQLPIAYTITDEMGQRVAGGVLTESIPASGVIDVVFETALEAGDYRIEFIDVYGDEIIGDHWLFQRVVMPQISAEVTMESADHNKPLQWIFRPGVTVGALMRVTDESGVTLSSVPVSARVYRKPLGDREQAVSGWFPMGPEALLGDQPMTGGWRFVNAFEGETDALGESRVLIPVIGEAGNDVGLAQYWVDCIYVSPESGAVSAGWLAFVSNPALYEPQLRVDQRLVLAGQSISIEVSAKSPLGPEVRSRGRLRVERKRLEEVWLDGKGRQLTGEQYRKDRRKGGIFSGWLSSEDDAYRLVDSRYRREVVFSQRFVIGKAPVMHTVAIEDPGLYEVTWTDIDDAGNPVSQMVSVYCFDPDQWVSFGWSNEAISWIGPSSAPALGRNAGILLLPENIEQVWIKLEGEDDAHEMRPFAVDRGVVRVTRDRFVEVWDEARSIEIGYLDGTEFKREVLPFESLETTGKLDLSPADLGQFETGDVLTGMDGATGWLSISPMWRDVLRESRKSSPDESSRWSTSFGRTPYYVARTDVSDALEPELSTPNSRQNERISYPLGVSENGVFVSGNQRQVPVLSTGQYALSFLESNRDEPSLITIKEPAKIDIGAPNFVRGGDAFSARIDVGDLDEGQTLNVVFEADGRELARKVISPDEVEAGRVSLDIAVPSFRSMKMGQIQVYIEGGRRAASQMVSIHPRRARSSSFQVMQDVGNGIWQLDRGGVPGPLSHLLSAPNIWSLMRVVVTRSLPSEDGTVLDLLRDQVIDQRGTDYLGDRWQQFLSVEGGMSLVAHERTNLSVSVLTALIWTALGRSDEHYHALNAYLVDRAQDVALFPDDRAWILFVLSSRYDGVAGNPPSRKEVQAYQSLWRMRARLSRLSILCLSDVAKRYGLTEDRDFWNQLASRKGLTAIAPQFSVLTPSQQNIARMFLSDAGVAPQLRYSDTLGNENLLFWGALEKLFSSVVVEASASADFQITVDGVILIDDSLERKQLEHGVVQIGGLSGRRLGDATTSISLSVVGDQKPRAVWAVWDGPWINPMKTARQLRYVERQATLLTGFVESAETVEDNSVEIGLEDQVDVSLTIEVIEPMDTLFLRERLPSAVNVIGTVEFLPLGQQVDRAQIPEVEIREDSLVIRASNLPAGNWRLRYRLSPRAEGLYFSDRSRIWSNSLEGGDQFVEGWTLVVEGD
ncbi:MAG: hypothetical protein HRU10_05000 [Opitutales bacterium]|nr:hypothetical protein [Opitutales bacterium]